MLRSAFCIAARRLAFSAASDSVQALKSETKRNSRTSTTRASSLEPTTSGSSFVGHERDFSRRYHCSSSGRSRCQQGS